MKAKLYMYLSIQHAKYYQKIAYLVFFFLSFSVFTSAQTDSLSQKPYIQKITSSVVSVHRVKLLSNLPLDSTKPGDFLSTNATSFYKKRKNSLIQALYFQKDSFRLQFPRLFKLHGGQTSLIQQVGNREGVFPAFSPVTYTRFVFNGSVQIAGLPLRVDALYTTEQSAMRQPMNRLGVSLDVQQVKREMEAKIRSRITQLEQITRTDDLKDLERLKKFYDFMKVPSLDKEALKNKAMQMGKDSAAKYLALGKEKATHTGKEKTEKLKKNRTYTKLAAKSHTLKSKYANATHKATQTLEDGNRKLNHYLEKEKLTKAQIANWEKMRDSLAKFDAERLKNFDELTALKAVLNGDITQGVDILKKYDLIGKNSWVNCIKHIGVGTQYPSYSRFTLQGQPITGYAAELQIKNVYLAHTANKNQQAVPASTMFSRKLSAGRVGLGTAEGTHGFLTVLHGKDDVASFRRLDSLENGIIDTTFYNKPRENHVVSGELQYQWNTKLTLTGELAHSVTNMNLYASTGVYQSGQAYSLTLTAPLTPTTTVGIKAERIGEGFYSLGVPYLRNNLKGHELQIEQRLLHRHITLSSSYGKWNAISTQPTPAVETLRKLGVRTVFAFQKMPQITAAYQVHDIRTTALVSQLSIFTLNANHSYTLGSTHAVSSVTFSEQQNSQKSLGEKTAPVQTANRNVNYTQSAQFSFPLVVTATLTYADTQIPAQATAATQVQPTGKWITYGGTVTYTFFGRVQATVGSTYGNNQTEGVRMANFAETGVQVHKYLHIALRAEDSRLQTGKPETNYSETFGRITLSSRF